MATSCLHFLNMGILLFIMIASISASSAQPMPSALFNVMDFGATANASVDDRLAFLKAWHAACIFRSSSSVAIIVPSRKSFLVSSTSFRGPCLSPIIFQVLGHIFAPPNPQSWDLSLSPTWIDFENVNRITLMGPGVFDGQGQQWWASSCRKMATRKCRKYPTALKFNGCSNVVMKNIFIQNSQQFHLEFQNCDGVKASDLTISSPRDSPNTDGIHLASSRNVSIHNSIIGVGDDCISISAGTSNVLVSHIICGPGHGISIGSLGQNTTEVDKVFNIKIKGITFKQTENGVRIKTWQDGNGLVKNVMFENIVMFNVSNPILINQHYCDQEKGDCVRNETSSAIKIQDITFLGITGTSSTIVAIDLQCNHLFPCSGILLENILLTLQQGKPSIAYCQNAIGTTKGVVEPHSCLHGNIAS